VSVARAEILKRIADAVGPRPAEQETAREYRLAGALGIEERVELFCARVGEYRAQVHRVAEADVAELVSSICAASGATSLVVPSGVPAAWRRAELEFVDDHGGLSPRDLDRVHGALTGCTVAVAETGTIILTAGPAEGRRALSLVPDLHVCVVRETQVVELFPEAVATIVEDGLQRQPITFVSGPSATSDIELSRVEGVHGPRSLVVLVAKEAS
jgi:L-lactate dehydrogenase complex protein LldG